MKNERRLRAWLCGLAATLLATAASGAGTLELQQPGQLRVAVYADFPPYSAKGRGIDVALGRELARRLGLAVTVSEYPADEDMSDDLRNMVWKGHYLGAQPSDVMLHVPVDRRLAERNEQVKIFGPYHVESLAVLRNPLRVPPLVGSAALALEVFTREKVGVETTSLADDYLLTALNGRLRDNVVHFRSLTDAVATLRSGEIAAVMGTRGELEAALGPERGKLELGDVDMPELRIKGWALGMAVKADSVALAAALEQAVVEMNHDGTLARVFAEYGVSHRQP